MSTDIFADGPGFTIGTENCRCGSTCDWPCWQRLGITEEPCEECHCPPFDQPTGNGKDEPQ